MESLRHGDFDYESIGDGYKHSRQPEPAIERLIHRALGDARTVLNVGAGAGSYEPTDRHVVAVEPSASMRSQRPRHLTPAMDATAEQLPFDDDAFDASMATVTIHQWSGLEAGLREMRRVTRGPVVILTFDGDELERLWIGDYAPDFYEVERRRYPKIARVAELIGPSTDIVIPAIPFDCADGFTEAFYGRPEVMLDPITRRHQSAWGIAGPQVEQQFVDGLTAALASGEWDERYGHLRSQPTFEGSLRLLIGHP